MLCITRSPDEAIRIGGDITVHVFGVKGKKVSLGIEAPTETRVVRSELFGEVHGPAKRGSGIGSAIADSLRLQLRKYHNGTLTVLQLIDSFQAALK